MLYDTCAWTPNKVSRVTMLVPDATSALPVETDTAVQFVNRLDDPEPDSPTGLSDAFSVWSDG